MKLPYSSGSAFRLRTQLVRMAIGLGAAALMYVFYTALLELSAAHWQWFLIAMAIFVAGYAPTVHLLMARLDGDIVRVLDAGRERELEAEEIRAGFAGAVAFPRRGLVFSVWTWGLAAAVVPAIVKLRFPDFPWSAVVAVAFGTVNGGVLSAVFTYLADKHMVEPLRDTFAGEIADPGDRQALITRFGIAPKLRYAMTGVILVTVVLAVLLSRAIAFRPIESYATDIKLRYLERAAGRVGGPSDPVVDLVRLDAEELGIANRVVLLNRRTGKVANGTVDALTPSEIRWVLDAGGEGGTSRGLDSDHAFAWVVLEDDENFALVAATPRAMLNGGREAGDVVFALLGLLAAAIGFGAAHFIARDLSRAVDRLRREAERIAGGDLTRGDIIESEDELGDLARAFERMSGSLRATVARVAEAAEGVDAAATQLASVGGSVGSAAAGQREALEQAATSVATVNSQIAGITESAQGLTGNVEEASSSVLELGAASEQLNSTASSLSNQVEGVSASIEQMVHSVSRIGAGAESLAAAAGETSSSMTEMAASMCDVEENASETSRLSSQVVELAEGGRERVQKTIAGMDAIREATETADAVIRGLGTRVQEIGAIVDVIDDVADETSLLALNAAIIAAQAGDQGRAFSVVADEITELADRVLNSTKEIGGLIRAVQEESANAIRAIEDGTRSVQEGVELSAGAGVSLEEITGASRASGERIQEIVHAVREQSRAAGHVSELMERVSRGVGDIQTAGSEQERGNEVVMSGTGAMRDVSQQVHRTTEEQARGASRIRDSMESVRDAVDRIHESLREQSGACRQAVSFLETVFARTRSHEESSGLLREATDGLRRQAVALRQDVNRFRI